MNLLSKHVLKSKTATKIQNDDRLDGQVDNVHSTDGAQRLCFDGGALSRAEIGCRDIVATDPTDMGARVELAWCLFLQAMHWSGRESVLNVLEHERRISRLITECNRQMVTVIHLSTSRNDLMSMECLNISLQLSCGTAATALRTDLGEQILAKLTRAILDSAVAAPEICPITAVGG